MAGGLGGVLVVAALIGLKWYSLFGMADAGRACRTRLGCKSQMCAAHERRGGALVASDGYCTAKCAVDGDCPTGTRCEPTARELRGDIPGIGIPDHLCVRAR